jgi:RNA polymerase sigma-70 factor (ECF subfamily)
MPGSLMFDLNSEASNEATKASEDRELVAGLKTGAEDAYEKLLSRFQQPVYNLALRLLSNPGDAGDVAQEVFLKVFRNVTSFRNQSSLKTWIYRITVNEAHNQRRWFFRHRSREVGLDDETDDVQCRMVPDSGRTPFDYTFDGEKHLLIEAALAQLNPVFREAVVLRDIEDLSYDEIAEVLQISIGTVKSRFVRGREALREGLTGQLEASPAMHWEPKTAG